MPGATVALLGDLDARRELGKVGTQSDIHLHDVKVEGRDLTTIVPDRFPDQIKCLSYAVCGADAAVLVISGLDAQVGEQILAADAADIRHGVIVLRNYVQPEQIAPLIAGTCLEGWLLQTEEDWGAARAHLAQAPVREAEGPGMVPVDHHFDVKGVGAVVLGVVARGTIRKSDTLHAWPDRVICPIKSIQIHDADHPEATVGDRVGLALRNVKADQLDRGQVLAPADAPLTALKVGDPVRFTLHRSAFSKQAMAAGSVVHLGLGMQFVPVRLDAEAPGAGESAVVEGHVEKPLVVAPADSGVLWHVDSPQRVVGRVVFE